eukprot:comp23801_c1_seq1/m.41381 comp23801_c1_seq1/g.41381  ORF comp23801_c1_seq1/g.41381 comp23801_c1_seq1/m.41381 type:complete len:266 (-) comp23801_c1_seq1:30-827(-)
MAPQRHSWSQLQTQRSKTVRVVDYYEPGTEYNGEKEVYFLCENNTGDRVWWTRVGDKKKNSPTDVIPLPAFATIEEELPTKRWGALRTAFGNQLITKLENRVQLYKKNGAEKEYGPPVVLLRIESFIDFLCLLSIVGYFDYTEMWMNECITWNAITVRVEMDTDDLLAKFPPQYLYYKHATNVFTEVQEGKKFSLFFYQKAVVSFDHSACKHDEPGARETYVDETGRLRYKDRTTTSCKGKTKPDFSVLRLTSSVTVPYKRVVLK